MPAEEPDEQPVGLGRPVLRATGLTKHFAGVTALREAGITLRAGEVHALVGENGAGKSTLVRLLSGVIRPDAGHIEVDGGQVVGSAASAAAHGVAAVAQELSLFGDLTVAENLFPNRPPTVRGLTSARAVAAKAGPVLAELGLRVPMDARVATLPLADRQLLEVCRAMVAGPRVLILDEPTSSLPRAAAFRLRGVIRALAGRGIAVLYISHFLEEVLELADRITVLRDGAVVRAGVPSATVRLTDLVTAMLGDVAPTPRQRTRRAGNGTTSVVRFEHVSLPARLVDVSFASAAGEVVGLAGLEDAGHLAALEVVTGRAGAASGTVEVAGGPAPRSLRAAIRSGVAFVSSDRKRYGLMLDEPVWLNVGAVSWLGLGRGSGWLKTGELVAASVRHGRRLRIRGAAHQPVGSLSGGNQQKVVLAKWLEAGPVLLVLDDPTRGVDVGARVEVHDVIAELADAGTSVLLASTDLAELVAVCDWVLVFQRGRIVQELAGGRLTEQELSVAMNAGFTA
jgi:ABC-type sugar transport system ATPase subunit